MTRKYQPTYSEVATMSWVRGSHHVLGIKHLLRQLGYGDSTVLLAAACRQRSETSHEEVQTGEGYLTVVC